jgi:rubrerythrin
MLQYLFQKLVSEELFAALFYEAAANMLLCKGFKTESKKYRDIAREELEHVEELTEVAYKYGFPLEFAILDNRVISTNSWKTVESIVSFAINLEQEAIDSYTSALSKVFEEDNIKVLEHILKEEKEHKIDFEEMYKDFLKGDIKDFKCNITSGYYNVSNTLAHVLKGYI